MPVAAASARRARSASSARRARFLCDAALCLFANKTLPLGCLALGFFARQTCALPSLAFALGSLPLGELARGLLTDKSFPFGLGANGLFALRLLFQCPSPGFSFPLGLFGGMTAGVFRLAARIFLLALCGKHLLALGKRTFAGSLLAGGDAVAQSALRRLIFHFAGDALAIDLITPAAHLGVALGLFARTLIAFARLLGLDAGLFGHFEFALASLLALGCLTGCAVARFMLHVVQLGVALDAVDRRFQLSALLSGGRCIGDVLLTHPVFQRHTRGLIDAGTLLRISPGADPLKSLSDGRFQTQMLLLLQRIAVIQDRLRQPPPA